MNYSLTFDELKIASNTLTLGDFHKFCKDFELGISKSDQAEIYRRICTKNKIKLADFRVFKELLREVFFVLEIKKTLKSKLEEVERMKSLDASLQWS